MAEVRAHLLDHDVQAHLYRRSAVFEHRHGFCRGQTGSRSTRDFGQPCAAIRRSTATASAIEGHRLRARPRATECTAIPNGRWDEPVAVSEPDTVVCRVRPLDGRLVMSVYRNASMLYTTHPAPLSVELWVSDDGRAWSPLDPDHPVSHVGGAEAEFLPAADGRILVTVRKEGPNGGWGSDICLSEAGAPFTLVTLRSIPRKLDSPLLFESGGRPYLIARRAPWFGGRFDLGLSISLGPHAHASLPRPLLGDTEAFDAVVGRSRRARRHADRRPRRRRRHELRGAGSTRRRATPRLRLQLRRLPRNRAPGSSASSGPPTSIPSSSTSPRPTAQWDRPTTSSRGPPPSRGHPTRAARRATNGRCRA